MRSGFVHSYNNYNHIDGVNKIGMNPRYGGTIKGERNHSDDARSPLATFYTDDLSSWEVIDNYFSDTVLWLDKNTPDHDSSGSVDGGGPFYPAGPNPTSTSGTLGVLCSQLIPWPKCRQLSKPMPVLIKSITKANPSTLHDRPLGPNDNISLPIFESGGLLRIGKQSTTRCARLVIFLNQ